MSEQQVKVGDIVFAADLVKVLKATLYYTITYYDLNSLNLSQKMRAHRAFELLSTDYAGFLYWNINDVSVENNAIIEEGLTADTSAYMRADSKFTVTYYNYGQPPKYITSDIELFSDTYNNDIYLSNICGLILTLRTDTVCEIAASPFLLSTYRFIGWKKNDYGDIIQPYDNIPLQIDTQYYALWIKQYWFKFGNIPAYGKTTLLDREYRDVGKTNFYDVDSSIRLSVCPNEHYHFSRIDVNYIDENGNTPPITSFVIDKVVNNVAELVLSNNIEVTSIYAIDTYKLSFNTYYSNVGTVKVVIDSDTYTNNTTEMHTIEKPWNTKLYLLAMDSRLSSFLRWEGNVPNEYVYNNVFKMHLTYDLTATAMYMPNTVYSVNVYTNNANFGTVATNRDPETPELPYGTYVLPYEGYTFDVTITATPKENCKFLYWIDSSGNKYTAATYVLTNFIDKNYQLTAYFDTWLIEHNEIPIITNDGLNIDYSNSNLK